MAEDELSADIISPSALSCDELDRWSQMQLESPPIQRAFLAPTFALACERAYGRVFVAVLHTRGVIRGFLPYQFRSTWHQRLGLAERVGGEMSDAAGVIAQPGFRITSRRLLRLVGISSLVVSHLVPGQDQLGLEAEWPDIDYLTDLRVGNTDFYKDMLQRERSYVRDTERQIRRATEMFGALSFDRTNRVAADAVATVIEQKRQQYRRTQVADTFANAMNTRLIAALREAPGPDCWLVQDRLLAGDNRVLAQHLGLQFHDVLSFWFPVYDPAAHTVSPGRLLLWYLLCRAKEYGIGLVDYGVGDDVYKRRFATEHECFGRAHWFSGGLRSVAAHAWQALAWRWQARRHRSGSLADT